MKAITPPAELPDIPIEDWLAPKEIAGHFGLSAWSAYRWVNEGVIPQNHVKYSGNWRIRIHPAAVPMLEKAFAAAHGFAG